MAFDARQAAQAAVAQAAQQQAVVRVVEDVGFMATDENRQQLAAHVVDFLLRRLGHAGRRHLAPAQFAHNFLEDLGVFGHGLGAKLVQKEVTGGNELVVATEAVGLNGGPRRFGTLRDLVNPLAFLGRILARRGDPEAGSGHGAYRLAG